MGWLTGRWNSRNRKWAWRHLRRVHVTDGAHWCVAVLPAEKGTWLWGSFTDSMWTGLGPHTKQPFTPLHSTPLHYWGFTSLLCTRSPSPTVFLLMNDLPWILTSNCDAGLSTFSPRGATIQVGFQSGITLSRKGFLPGRTGGPAGLWPRGLGLDTPSQRPQSATDQPFNLTLYISNHIYGFPNRVKARRYVAMGRGEEGVVMWKFESDVVIKTSAEAVRMEPR